MKYKEYEKLNFNSLYKTKKYPKVLWPILNEYFSRYKNELGLNNDEIYLKVNKVLNNLNTIKKEGSKKDFWNGLFVPDEKKIKINIDNIKRFNLPLEQIINTIFHELNHAGEDLANDEGTTSFQLYNANTNKFEGVALNEIITEMKSSRLACNDRTELLNKTGNDRVSLQLTGYGDLIFIGTMLHTALGIGEKEFLCIADKGKAEFDRQMREKFPPGDESYDNFMNSIIYYSDMLHSIKYNGNGEYTEQDKTNMLACIDNIRDHCMYAMGRRMAYEAFKNRDSINMTEFTTKCRFEIDKMAINYEKGMSYIMPGEEIQFKSEYIDDVKRQVLEYETIDSNKDKLSFSQISELLHLSSEGQFISNKMESEYGITHSSDITNFDKTMNLEYETKLLKEEYGELPWDNTALLNSVEKFSKSNFLINIGKTVVMSVRSTISDYKTRKSTKKLPESKQSIVKTLPENSKNKTNEFLNDLNGMVKTEQDIYQEPISSNDRQKDEHHYYI